MLLSLLIENIRIMSPNSKIRKEAYKKLIQLDLEQIQGLIKINYDF